MKKNIIILTLLLLSTATVAVAQEKSASLEILGSVDTYYKYDFNKVGNIRTYFASDQNSVSLGMIDLALKKTTGKAAFVGEISFGPRGQEQALATAADGNSFHIQNLYVDYSFSDKFKMTAGFMGTFIGYEVISPTANFNYSTSYLFGAGPFQNAGIKGTYRFSDNVSLMLGLFNEWNVYTASRGVSSVGGQLMIAPVEGLCAYFNGLYGLDAYGKYSTIIDLTTSYQIDKKMKIGLNAATYAAGKNNNGYSGVALYPQYAFSSAVALGLRAEYFRYNYAGSTPHSDVTSFTLSGNVKAGGLTFIPELRLDNDKDLTQGFLKSDGVTLTKSAAQFSLAVVYSF